MWCSKVRSILGLVGGLASALWPVAGLAQATVDASRPVAQAELTLEIEEKGVLVQVDGAVRGVTPLEVPLVLRPGPHQLELSKAGLVSVRQELELEVGPQTRRFKLRSQATAAKLSVGASTLPAELWLDGEPVGALPWSGEVPPGEHALIARSEAAVSEERRVSVLVGEHVVITLGLVARRGQPSLEVEHASNEAAATRKAVVERPPVWPGVYGQLGLWGWFSRRPTDELSRECPAASAGGRCDWSPSYGGGLALRVGYSFGWLAVEGLVAGVGDGWYDQLRYDLAQSADEADFYGPPRSERYTFARYGGAFGVGARVLTPTQGVRGTFGLVFGFLARVERYFRVSTAMSRITSPLGSAVVPDARAETSGADSQLCPLLLADVGVLFGSTPGLRLQLGVLLAASFGAQTEAPARSGTLGRDATGQPLPFGSGAIDISRGSQLFFGPILGAQFGH